jgi:NAD(P)-dependent dehydrogenase (short-subunit alcohol dehydrogenase family)
LPFWHNDLEIKKKISSILIIMKDFNGKVVVITGAGSGIGRALSVAFAKQGAKLALNDYQAKNLEETVTLLGSSTVKTWVFDVSNREAVYSFADEVIAHYGVVDVVINNAGVAISYQRVQDVNYKDFEWLMGINFWGVVYGSKAFLPYLMTRPEASLVNVSSVYGLGGIAENSAYCSAKFAVRGFTESLRMEAMLQGGKMTVATVHPGGIDTNIVRNAPDFSTQKEHEKFITQFQKNAPTPPEKAAEIIIKGIQKKSTRILIGNDARLMDRVIRLLPEFSAKIIMQQMRKRKLIDNW